MLHCCLSDGLLLCSCCRCRSSSGGLLLLLDQVRLLDSGPLSLLVQELLWCWDVRPGGGANTGPEGEVGPCHACLGCNGGHTQGGAGELAPGGGEPGGGGGAGEGHSCEHVWDAALTCMQESDAVHLDEVSQHAVHGNGVQCTAKPTMVNMKALQYMV
jgi:hypothetical protein